MRYYRGVLHRARGELKQATETFRGLLAEHPELGRVRLELAHSLYLMQQDESAKHHFELLLGGSASDPDLEKTVRGYISSIDSRRRWDFSSYVSLAPSTNINQGAQKREVAVNGLKFELSDANVKQRGVGLLTGFHSSYRHPLNESWDLVATAGVHVKKFKETDFNNLVASASFGPRWRFERGFIGLYAIVDERWIADQSYGKSWGYLLSTAYQFNGQNTTFNDISCSRRAFEDDWRGSSLTY